jgi:hypothetical protein
MNVDPLSNLEHNPGNDTADKCRLELDLGVRHYDVYKGQSEPNEAKWDDFENKRDHPFEITGHVDIKGKVMDVFSDIYCRTIGYNQDDGAE